MNKIEKAFENKIKKFQYEKKEPTIIIEKEDIVNSTLGDIDRMILTEIKDK